MMMSSPLWLIGFLLLILPLHQAWLLWLQRRASASEAESDPSPTEAEVGPGSTKPSGPKGRGSDPEVAPSRPPRQQYLFAHFLLRMTARGDPEAWLALRRANKDAERLLAALWAQAGFFYGSPFEMRPKDVLVARGGALPRAMKAPQARAIPGGVLVLMPIVTTITDAYAIAIVERGDELRYYTLEKGEVGDLFCEWQSDGSHHRRGAANSADLDAFVARARLEADQGGADDEIAVNAPGGAA
ncbi:MAG: hypothetical protein MUF34_14310 [Polyangiaceae bacterium]|nr:hypothetical protein [Polyangiaceae bacterium]